MPRSKIEIEFAFPVDISDDNFRRLMDIVTNIVKQPENQREGYYHWVAGYGDKPTFSKADSRLLGKPVNPNAPETGEPEFDGSILHIETSTREKRPGEK